MSAKFLTALVVFLIVAAALVGYMPSKAAAAVPASCEDVGQTTVSVEVDLRQHVMWGDAELVAHFAPPPEATFVLLRFGWEWSGREGQVQTDEIHKMTTPFGKVVSEDYGDKDLGVIWFAAQTGKAQNFDAILEHAGSGLSAGSHYSHLAVSWCKALPTPEPTTVPAPEPTPIPEPIEYKVFLSLVRRDPAPMICSMKAINVELVGLNLQGEMQFTSWPGNSYSNIVMPYGEVIKFTVSDGTKVDSSISWYHSDERGDSWYHYLEAASSWSYTATFDEEDDWSDLTPGYPWMLKFSYWDRGTLCVSQIDIQWDPPEANIDLLMAGLPGFLHK